MTKFVSRNLVVVVYDNPIELLKKPTNGQLAFEKILNNATSSSGSDTALKKTRASLMATVKPSHREIKGNSKEQTEETLSLTARQKEILRLVAQGHTNREIGEQLDISVRTVEVHRFNLMRRLHVRNVAQLLRQGMRLRLIPKSTVPTSKAP